METLISVIEGYDIYRKENIYQVQRFVPGKPKEVIKTSSSRTEILAFLLENKFHNVCFG